MKEIILILLLAGLRHAATAYGVTELADEKTQNDVAGAVILIGGLIASIAPKIYKSVKAKKEITSPPVTD